MLSFELLRDLQEYIKNHFTGEEPAADACAIPADKIEAPHLSHLFRARFKELAPLEEFDELTAEDETILQTAVAASCCFEDLKERISSIDESFSDMLLKKIDSLGMTDAECYKKAQLNRSHFNRIKNDPEYHIQKETVFALALALSLSKAEADEFLQKAGFAFSPSSKADLIVEYCINNGIYDVIEVNQLLYAFDQKLLGAGIRE